MNKIWIGTPMGFILSLGSIALWWDEDLYWVSALGSIFLSLLLHSLTKKYFKFALGLLIGPPLSFLAIYLLMGDI